MPDGICRNCFSSGSLDADDIVGGFVGDLCEDAKECENCFYLNGGLENCYGSHKDDTKDIQPIDKDEFKEKCKILGDCFIIGDDGLPKFCWE